MTPEILILAFVSALIPVVFWFFILRRKQHKGMFFRFLTTFLLSGTGAVFFLYFKDSLHDALQIRTGSILLVYLLFGIGIEYFKNLTVRIGGFRFFRNIDDVMDLSFAAALGFTFFENFYYLSITFSGLNPEVIGPVKMLKYFLLRELFILPVHLFCTGIFGYFYGIGLFAGDKLQEKNRTKLLYKFIRGLLFFVPSSRAFKAVKIAQGTLISVIFYGLFFTFLEQDLMVSDLLRVLNLPKIPVDEQLIPVIAFVFFKMGTIFLFNLMDRKRRWSYDRLLTEK